MYYTFDSLKKKVKATKNDEGVIMVQIIHCGENQDKLDKILQVAQTRFGMYGLEKTTMREIADDLSMSKASLYYYFQDKNELFHAVIEKEQHDYLTFLSETVEGMTDPSDKILAYVKLRNDYFRKFMNLSKLRFASFMAIRPLLDDLFNNLRQKELEFLKEQLVVGIESGIYEIDDLDSTAGLFYEILISIRWKLYKKSHLMDVDVDDFKEVEDRTKQFVHLFIRGIESKKTK